MARTARLEMLGLPLHVIVQGHGRRDIVRDDIDRSRLLRRMASVFREDGVEVFAWALLDNHLHVAARTTTTALARPMQRALGAYAREFNYRHDLVGRLVRDRFLSRPVEDDDDLLNLIAYVSLNPIRAGIVRSLRALQHHPWSSLSELCYPERRRHPLVTPSAVLPLFGAPRPRAIDELLAMLAGRLRDDPTGLDYVVDGPEPRGVDALSQRESEELESDCTFALALRTDRIDRVLRERRARSSVRLRLEERGWDVDAVLVRACGLVRSRPSAVRRGARRRSDCRARALVAHFASGYLRLPLLSIAEVVGVSRQAAGLCARRGAALADDLGLTVESFFELDVE